MLFPILWGFVLAQRLKRLPAMWENWVRSLGREDPLEKEAALEPTPVFLPGESHGLYSQTGQWPSLSLILKLDMTLWKCIRCRLMSITMYYRSNSPNQTLNNNLTKYLRLLNIFIHISFPLVHHLFLIYIYASVYNGNKTGLNSSKLLQFEENVMKMAII